MSAIASCSNQIMDGRDSLKREEVIHSFTVRDGDNETRLMSWRYMAPYPAHKGVGERNICKYHHTKWGAIATAVTALLPAAIIFGCCVGCEGFEVMESVNVCSISVSVLGGISCISLGVTLAAHVAVKKYLNQELNQEQVKNYLMQIDGWAQSIIKSQESSKHNTAIANQIRGKLTD